MLSSVPSVLPSDIPSSAPSTLPSVVPSNLPSDKPSLNPSSGGLENLAQKGNATHHMEHGSYNADALLAIDGITDGFFDHGSVRHTDKIYTN